MSAPAYRKASRQTLVWLVICLCGVAGQIAVMMLSSVRALNPWWMFLIGALPFFAALLIAIFVCSYLKRGRFGRIAKRLEPEGFEFFLKPTPEEKQEFFTPLAPLKAWMDLREGSEGTDWFAIQPHSEGPLRLFEYEFVTGTGKGKQVHTYTVAAWPATRSGLRGARLGWLTGFKMSCSGWWTRRIWKKLEMRDPAFSDLAKRWALFGDISTGHRFLSAGVREKLADSPKGESWYIGGGWACCLFAHPLDAENLVKFIERAQQILNVADTQKVERRVF